MTDPSISGVFPPDPDRPPVCRWCGVVVKRPDPADLGITRVYDTRRNPGLIERGLPAVVFEVRTALCSDHTALWRRAQALADRFPEVRRRHGNVGAERIAAALLALEVAMWAPLRPFASASFTSSADDLLAFVDALAPVGGMVAWSTSDGTGPSFSRWAHVTKEARGRARDAYRGHVLRSAELPTPLGPPDGARRGCIYCGRSTVLAKPSDAARAWGREYRVEANVLTPRESRAGLVIGHLCPTCRQSVAFDAIGLLTIERALLAFLGWELRTGYKLTRTTVFAWGALSPSYAPNDQPWQHLDLPAIRAGLPGLRHRGIAREVGEDWPGFGVVGYLDLEGAVDERRRS